MISRPRSRDSSALEFILSRSRSRSRHLKVSRDLKSKVLVSISRPDGQGLGLKKGLDNNTGTVYAGNKKITDAGPEKRRSATAVSPLKLSTHSRAITVPSSSLPYSSAVSVVPRGQATDSHAPRLRSTWQQWHRSQRPAVRPAAVASVTNTKTAEGRTERAGRVRSFLPSFVHRAPIQATICQLWSCRRPVSGTGRPVSTTDERVSSVVLVKTRQTSRRRRLRFFPHRCRHRSYGAGAHAPQLRILNQFLHRHLVIYYR